MKKIQSPPARKIVKSYWPWAVKALAEKMGKSVATISGALKNGRMNFFRRYDYTDAINELFGTNYSVDELFPPNIHK